MVILSAFKRFIAIKPFMIGIIALLLSIHPAQAGHITLTNASKAVPLSTAISQFEDNTGAPSAPQAFSYFKQLTHGDIKNPSNRRIIAFPSGKHTHWLQFTVTNESEKEAWVLSLGELFAGNSYIFNHLSVYEGENHIPIAAISTNGFEENRGLIDGTGIALNLTPGVTRTITLRLDTTKAVPLTIAPEIVESSVFKTQVARQKLIASGLVIICIVFISIALSMLVMSRLPSLLFFGLYLPLLILFTTAHEGVLHWFSPFLPVVLHEPLYIVSYFASLFFALLIFRHYLDIPDKSRIIDAAIILVAALIPLAPATLILYPNYQPWMDYLYQYTPLAVTLIGTILGLFYAFSAALPHSFWLSYLAMIGAYGALAVHHSLLPLNNQNTVKAFLILVCIHTVLLGIALITKIRLVLKQRFASEEGQRQQRKRQEEERRQRQKLIQQYESKVKEQEKEYLQELRRQDAAQKNELMAAKQEAERANEAKSDFLAMISHEIRTPLTGILGMVQLTGQSPLNPQQREYIDTIQYSGETLLALLNDILDFSKIEKGKLELETVSFNLSKLLKSILMLMSGRAGEKGLDLQLDLDETIPPCVQGDPTRIRQVLLNLINNSIKFTESGGITLRVEKLSDDGHFVKLKYSVIDTGIGLTSEAKARLFRAYSQADESISRKYGGTGLGLSICKKLITAMSGKIDVDSTQGKGSTFWFTIPMEIGKEQVTGEDGDTPVIINDKPLKILCVDDNEINTKVIAGLLSKHGHTVVTELSPLKALDLIRHESFDVILADMQMPHLSGPELAQAVRELTNPQKAKTPIIALTGNTSEDDMAICHRAGMNDFLVKPVSVEAMIRTLDAVMSGEGRFDTRPMPPEPEPLPEQPVAEEAPPAPEAPTEKDIRETHPLPEPEVSLPEKPTLEQQHEEKRAKSAPVKVDPVPEKLLSPKKKEPIGQQLQNHIDTIEEEEEILVSEQPPEVEESIPSMTPSENSPAPSDEPAKAKKSIMDKVNEQIAFLDMGTVSDIWGSMKKSVLQSVETTKKMVADTGNQAKAKMAEKKEAAAAIKQVEPEQTAETPVQEKPETIEPAIVDESVDEQPTVVPEEVVQESEDPFEVGVIDEQPEEPAEPMETIPEPPTEEPVVSEPAPEPAPIPEPISEPEPLPAPEQEKEYMDIPMTPPPAPETVEPAPPLPVDAPPVPEEAIMPPPLLDEFTPPAQMLDERMVKELHTSLGADTFKELYEELWEKADSIIELLNGAIADGNMKTVNERGHEIKGMCANFGLSGVSSVARDIEESGMREDKRTAAMLIPHLPELIRQSHAIIQDFIDGKIIFSNHNGDDEEDDKSDYLI